MRRMIPSSVLKVKDGNATFGKNLSVNGNLDAGSITVQGEPLKLGLGHKVTVYVPAATIPVEGSVKVNYYTSAGESKTKEIVMDSHQHTVEIEDVVAVTGVVYPTDPEGMAWIHSYMYSNFAVYDEMGIVNVGQIVGSDLNSWILTIFTSLDIQVTVE